MDGMGGRDGLTTLPDAILDHEGRIAASEQMIRERVSHEALNRTINDLRRDFITKIEQSEKHTGDKIDKLDAQNEKRLTQLQLQLTQAFQGMADAAAKRAVEQQREAEKQASEAVERKAKDAVIGVRVLFFAVGPAIGAGLLFIALLILKHTIGFSL